MYCVPRYYRYIIHLCCVHLGIMVVVSMSGCCVVSVCSVCRVCRVCSVWWRVLMAGFTKSGSTVSITVTGHRKSSATPSSASSAALEHRALQDHT